ncbi:MAG TPA: hypothetical protein PLC42_03975 [Parachlamydiaceae bacterium]|nr:hypothetical protein [Parachlamydiaceae bacterium]
MIKKIINFLFISFVFTFSLFADYQKPSLVSNNVWKDIQPYLLPYNHPLRKKMDKLFKSFRVTENAKSLQKAGFERWEPAFFSKAIISKNERIDDGYYFKFYSDEQDIAVESEQWINRAFEARNLAKTIKNLGYQDFFIVPKKWIYPIPDVPRSKSAFPKNFILIAKKIGIEKSTTSRYKWQNRITKKMLKALYTVIEKEGLVDSLASHNVPFSKDDKLVFVDLEHHHKWPVPFEKLLKYLNPSMQIYWKQLIDRKGF